MVLHQEQINEILELYRYGWLQKEIAEKFQIGNRTVGRLLKRYGIESRVFKQQKYYDITNSIGERFASIEDVKKEYDIEEQDFCNSLNSKDAYLNMYWKARIRELHPFLKHKIHREIIDNHKKVVKILSTYVGKDNRVRACALCEDGTKISGSYARFLLLLNGVSLEKDDDVHHIDGNPLNNDLSNLKVLKHGEHQRMHSLKYFDKEMTCPVCGKKFIWTAKRQQRHSSNVSRKDSQRSQMIVCSKSCAGKLGKIKQMKNAILNHESDNIDVFDLNYNLIQSFYSFEDCVLFVMNRFSLTIYRAREEIRRVLKGKRESYHGYIFKYA